MSRLSNGPDIIVSRELHLDVDKNWTEKLDRTCASFSKLAYFLRFASALINYNNEGYRMLGTGTDVAPNSRRREVPVVWKRKATHRVSMGVNLVLVQLRQNGARIHAGNSVPLEHFLQKQAVSRVFRTFLEA